TPPCTPRQVRGPGRPRSPRPGWYGRRTARPPTARRDGRLSTVPPLARKSGRASPGAPRSRSAIPTRTAAPAVREGPPAQASARGDAARTPLSHNTQRGNTQRARHIEYAGHARPSAADSAAAGGSVRRKARVDLVHPGQHAAADVHRVGEPGVLHYGQ